MTISDGRQVLVDPAMPHEEIARLHGVDRVVLMPDVAFCPAVHLDGPLAGERGYAVNDLGSRGTSLLPPFRPGGPGAVYEVARLADDDHPAELRFVGYRTDRGDAVVTPG
ncbi:hypothetical protein H4696_003120 [Amycolatopsis lexingtonensis]|uniref:Uncharacterized protein n=1 Tax=Amycolatopsis lexingtonensis TaxID=218822 RepID=A0ABR9HYL1_9PSEU|nr:hypothetical protein [Amycolatopsis lexingtonensis]MBE1496020.1 hypothetical protein [Amycolatopsis lexingtonensis]